VCVCGCVCVCGVVCVWLCVCVCGGCGEGEADYLLQYMKLKKTLQHKSGQKINSLANVQNDSLKISHK